MHDNRNRNYFDQHYSGFFWKADNEERKIPGTLYIDKEGNAFLTTFHRFNENKQINADDDVAIVFGIVMDNKELKKYVVRMNNIFVKSEHIPLSINLPVYKYISKEVYISKEIGNCNCSTLYNQILLLSPDINNWVKEKGFGEVKHPKNPQKFGATFDYRQPEKIDLFKNDELNIYLYFNAWVSYPIKRKAIIEEKVYLNIKLNQAKTLEELKKYKTSIERLFSLIFLQPIQFDEINYVTTSKKDFIALKKEKKEMIYPSDCVNYQIFTENSQQIIENWFQKEEKLSLALKTFFSVYGQPGLLVEDEFLSYISILENLYKQIPHKASFKNPPLKNIIKYFLSNSNINTVIENIDDYSEILKITRNYLAHLEEKHEENALKTKDLYKTNQILIYIIQEYLIRELGIEQTLRIPDNI